VLRDSTMGAFAAALDHASQRLEMIIRLMAETGIKCAIRKAHRLVRESFGPELALKLRGQWANVNPQEWRERTDLKVSVGVGTQNRQEKVAALSAVMAIQKELMPLGMASPEHIYNAVSELITANGIEGPERFLLNPAKQPLPQQQPDPLVMAQVESLKVQAQAMQLDAQSKMTRAQIEGAKAQLDRERAQFEASMKAREADLQAQQALWAAQTAAGEAQAKVQNINADSALKAAQRVKTLEEARALDIDSDAQESQVIDILKSVANGDLPQPSARK